MPGCSRRRFLAVVSAGGGLALIPSASLLGACGRRGRVCARFVETPHAILFPGRSEQATLLEIAEAETPADAVRSVLRVHERDRRRIRIRRRLAGGNLVQVIGPCAREHHVLHDHDEPPVRDWRFELLIDAITVPGDPSAPAPEDLRGVDPRSRVWVELINELPGADDAAAAPRMELTLAPLLIPPEIHPVRRLFVPYDSGTDVALARDSHPMVYDLLEACRAAGLDVELPPNTWTRISLSSLDTPDAPIVVLDANRYSGDIWLRDQVKLGACSRPAANAGDRDETVSLAVDLLRFHPNSIRPMSLERFAREDLAQAGMSVLFGLMDAALATWNHEPFMSSKRNFGGNIVASPPVPRATGTLPDLGGPRCPPHDRPAPFGKILFGDIRPRVAHGFTRSFLQAQRAQPILPIDTSWLHTGHVDEIAGFVRSTRPPRFKLLIAAPWILSLIYDAILRDKLDYASIHAGKYLGGLRAGGSKYGEETVEAVQRRLGGRNAEYQHVSLTPVQLRLQAALDLQDGDVIPVPVYFDEVYKGGAAGNPGYAANLSAHTADMVNCCVIKEDVILPRPFGPRLRRTDAERVVASALGAAFDDPPDVSLPEAERHLVWVRPPETLQQVAMYFASPYHAEHRKKLLEALQAGATSVEGLPEDDVRAAVEELTAKIKEKNPLAADGWSDGQGGNYRFTRCERILIPDDSVDVVEGYMTSVLRAHGNRVHFVDSFEWLHLNYGNLHCATLTTHAPFEDIEGFTERWWHPDLQNAPAEGDYNPEEWPET
jgi:hypothetical protein